MKIRLVVEILPDRDPGGSFHDLARMMEFMARAMRHEADRLWACEKERVEQTRKDATKERAWKKQEKRLVK
jgi:hypothetical protein